MNRKKNRKLNCKSEQTKIRLFNDDKYILKFVQGQFKSQKIQSPNPSYASSLLHKKMYLPLIKLSLVFLLYSKLGFVKGTEDELEIKLLQNFMSLFTRQEPRGRRERASTNVEV